MHPENGALLSNQLSLVYIYSETLKREIITLCVHDVKYIFIANKDYERMNADLCHVFSLASIDIFD